MDLNKEDFERLFEVFKVECDEHIQNLNEALISLEENPDQSELIEEVFREAHSLKGAARMINFSSIEQISHHLETILGKVKSSEMTFSSEISGLVLKGLDVIETIVQSISEGDEENKIDTSGILHELERAFNPDVPDKAGNGKEADTESADDETASELHEDDFSQFLAVFKVECKEHIQNLNEALISLEENPNQPDLIETVFREAHSLKGAARMMNVTSIENISHQLESILGSVKNKRMDFSTEVGDLVLKGLDAVENILQDLSENDKSEGSEAIDADKIIAELKRAHHIQAAVSKGENGPASHRSNTTASQAPSEIKGDIALFSQETRDAHKKLVTNLLELERESGRRSALKNAYEQAYALKGSARIIKHLEMGDLSLSLEKLLHEMMNGAIPVSKNLTGALLDATDLVNEYIGQIEADAGIQPSPHFKKINNRLDAWIKTASSPIDKKTKTAQKNIRTQTMWKKPPTGKQSSTVRVSSEKLDRLMDQGGELLIMKLKARQRLTDIQTIIDDFNVLQRDIKKNPRSSIKLKRLHKDNHEYNPTSQKTPNTEIREKLSPIFDQLESLQKYLDDDFRQFSITLDRLQDDIKKTRLFPFQTILDVFPRMVRDLSLAVKKQVKLVTIGGHIELDKYILEEMKDPLMHIIRNCIDHGIESPEERTAQGKPETGLITVDVSHKGNNGVIKVMDDGRGILTDKIKKSAIKKSLFIEKDLDQMNEKQVLNLIFHPGFSTNEIITDISGRGVGMDVVKSNIEKLKGTIELDTEPSNGSTFTMTIPLTLSTTQSLKISVNGETYFLPVNMVERIIRVIERDLPVVEGYPTVYYSGSYIPYVKMGSILELHDAPQIENAHSERPVAILRNGNTLVAFGMDHFMGEEEILMKGLGHYMQRVCNISGVTIMRDGNIAPVLNVTDLINTVQLKGVTRPHQNTAKKDGHLGQAILVVDDSAMTRTLEKNILESYGFRVTTAVDGQDAISKLQEHHFDVIVSDIQMPNINGLDFTGQVKQDDRYKHIPVILVTALESDEDKKKGIEVGADAYIAKSSFDQSNLLRTIQRLV
ncbi:MAG: Hpt domain-containing protein [Nitrospiria bacterium]